MSVWKAPACGCLAIICLTGLPMADAEESEPTTVDGVEDEADITVEDILANPLDDDAYDTSTRCLTPGRYRRIEIVNDRVLVFHARRGEDVWVNFLANRCLGLSPDMILEMDRQGMRLCARDRFRALPRLPGGVGSMPCILGDFHRVASDSVGAIRGAIEASNRTTTVNRTVESSKPDDREESVPEE